MEPQPPRERHVPFKKIRKALADIWRYLRRVRPIPGGLLEVTPNGFYVREPIPTAVDPHCFEVSLAAGDSESSYSVKIEPCKVLCEQTLPLRPLRIEPEYDDGSGIGSQYISSEDFNLTIDKGDIKKLYFKHTLVRDRGPTVSIKTVLLDSAPADGTDEDGSTLGNFEWVHVADIDTEDGNKEVTQILKESYFWPTGTVQKFWWDMTFDDSVTPVTLDIEDGLCIAPTYGSSNVPPQPAWGYSYPTIAQQTAVNGTTYFYIKATSTPNSIDVGGTTTDGLTIQSTRYSFGTFVIHKVTSATQPADTDDYKYQLLGKITISAGAVTDYWWRTNHAFNWTYYAYTTDTDDSNSAYLPIAL